LVRVAFWSKSPVAFNRAHVLLARRIAYHLGLGACRGEVGNVPHHIDDARAQRADAGAQRGVEQLAAGTDLRIVGESVEWRGVLRKATQVASTDTTVLVTGNRDLRTAVARRLS
jgi:transcriptional regulator with PAS, ATPase and Fis domain